MGLDQMAYKTKDERASGAFKMPGDDGDDSNPIESEQLAQWRKHPDLHGWMRELYRTKGGNVLPLGEDGDTYMHEEFNAGEGVELTLPDLDDLEKAVRNRTLPHTKGFFFAESCPDEDEPGDLKFIMRARTAIAEGYRVYYTSWW